MTEPTTHLKLPQSLLQAQPSLIQQSQQVRTEFNHIPHLRELLPKKRGLPGFTYMQCSLSNTGRAQNEGWGDVDGNVVYNIVGPKGSIEMKLLVRGKMTYGQSHDSGARVCGVDWRPIFELTGHVANFHLPERQEDILSVTKDFAQEPWRSTPQGHFILKAKGEEPAKPKPTVDPNALAPRPQTRKPITPPELKE